MQSNSIKQYILCSFLSNLFVIDTYISLISKNKVSEEARLTRETIVPNTAKLEKLHTLVSTAYPQ